MLIAHQVDPQRAHPRAINSRSADRRWERRSRLVPAPTTQRVRSMLADQQPDLGQIKHLTNPMPDILTSSQISTAALTDRREMVDDLIGSRNRLQMLARVPPAPRPSYDPTGAADSSAAVSTTHPTTAAATSSANSHSAGA